MVDFYRQILEGRENPVSLAAYHIYPEFEWKLIA
jgi:hypothetical protein